MGTGRASSKGRSVFVISRSLAFHFRSTSGSLKVHYLFTSSPLLVHFRFTFSPLPGPLLVHLDPINEFRKIFEWTDGWKKVTFNDPFCGYAPDPKKVFGFMGPKDLWQCDTPHDHAHLWLKLTKSLQLWQLLLVAATVINHFTTICIERAPFSFHKFWEMAWKLCQKDT